MASVSVRAVSRSFGVHKALDTVSIEFPDGGFYALLGPSGSGKTTLLRMIAGFDFPDTGSIVIGGENVERVPVERRRIGMVFQSYALFPNMSVADNVAFGLSVRGVARAEIARKVDAALELVQLGPLGRRRPHQLSGGQRQRVALARAIVTEPRVLLLDEPLSALDKALRTDMQTELKRIQREVGITTIFVTHDQEEALTMSDRLGILKDGRLIEEGPPGEIYDRPTTEFAATFLGDANLFRGVVEAGGLRLADGLLLPAPPPPDGIAPGEATMLAIRPERIELGPPDAPSLQLRGRVTDRLFTGQASRLTLQVGNQSVRAVVPNSGLRDWKAGDAISLGWPGSAAVWLSKGSDRRDR